MEFNSRYLLPTLGQSFNQRASIQIIIYNFTNHTFKELQIHYQQKRFIIILEITRPDSARWIYSERNRFREAWNWNWFVNRNNIANGEKRQRPGTRGCWGGGVGCAAIFRRRRGSERRACWAIPSPWLLRIWRSETHTIKVNSIRFYGERRKTSASMFLQRSKFKLCAASAIRQDRTLAKNLF